MERGPWREVERVEEPRAVGAAASQIEEHLPEVSRESGATATSSSIDRGQLELVRASFATLMEHLGVDSQNMERILEELGGGQTVPSSNDRGQQEAAQAPPARSEHLGGARAEGGIQGPTSLFLTVKFHLFHKVLNQFARLAEFSDSSERLREVEGMLETIHRLERELRLPDIRRTTAFRNLMLPQGYPARFIKIRTLERRIERQREAILAGILAENGDEMLARTVLPRQELRVLRWSQGARLAQLEALVLARLIYLETVEAPSIRSQAAREHEVVHGNVLLSSEEARVFSTRLRDAPLGSLQSERNPIGNLPSVVIEQRDVDGSQGRCPICIEDFACGEVVKQLPCRHFYHESCILVSLTYRNNCPACRYELPTRPGR